MHDKLQTEQVAQALQWALKGRKVRQQLVRHSGRGNQYCSDYWKKIHAAHGVTCSMANGYHCYQHALAERANGRVEGRIPAASPSGPGAGTADGGQIGGNL